ncbi:acyltransferase family protein [Sphingomonas sp. NBWT7]|uniref:acyltransferase family protein n=1 Tax=Sphingomonas sp. NBWT7 TaxID=2596913 RepID=UPI001623EBCF|nr:acyltransferase family protein [Sphingomonas sp. NBWT7]QNE31564.1 acyltransferase family protein [Sphingomonas sp. NBWT7]
MSDRAERIVGLDAWRAMLMLGGLFVHCSITLDHNRLFYVVEMVSQAFRMGVFFALSGYLAALTLRRVPSDVWYSRRLRQLGYPVMTGILLLSPATWWLLTTDDGYAGSPLLFEWWHFWFLWGLLLASALLRLLDRNAGVWRVIIAVAQRIAPLTLILATAVATSVMFALAPPAMFALLSPRLVRAYGNIQLIVGYLPTFLFGVLAARSDVVRDSLVRSTRMAAMVLVAIAGCYATAATGLLGAGEAYVRFVGAALCPPLVFAILLRTAATIRHVPPIVATLTDASYTIYLLHLPFAALINTRLYPPSLPANIAYPMTIVLAGGLSWLAHVLIVKRFRLAALLLNGRSEQRSARQPVATAITANPAAA